MSAILLDGEAVAARARAEVADRVARLGHEGIRVGLGTVLVGTDGPSERYVAMKHADCAEVGMVSVGEHLPENVTQAELDDLRFAEMLLQPLPQRIVSGEIPGDGFSISQRRFLTLIVALGFFKIEQVHVVRLGEALLGGFDRALIAAIFAFHRMRDIDAAEFLDRMVHDAVAEHGVPGIGK